MARREARRAKDYAADRYDPQANQHMTPGWCLELTYYLIFAGKDPQQRGLACDKMPAQTARISTSPPRPRAVRRQDRRR
jgi:hypothetical protein